MLTRSMGLIGYAKRNMNRRDNDAGAEQMAGLIVKKDMRSEYRQDFAFFNAAKKKRIIGHHAPAFQRRQRSFMGRRISGGNYRNAQSIFIAGMLYFIVLFRGLDV